MKRSRSLTTIKLTTIKVWAYKVEEPYKHALKDKEMQKDNGERLL